MPRLADLPYDLIRFQCINRGQDGQYPKATLIEQYGDDQTMFGLLAIMSADCPKRQANNTKDLCGCMYDLSPDL